MHRTPMLMLLFAIASFTLISCGGAGGRGKSAQDLQDAEIDEESKLDEEDLIPRAVLVSAVLTTEVDQKRYRATGPILSEFEPTQSVIYLVATLKDVPTQARIEVRWYRDADSTPILVSDIHGSDRFSFIADLKPAAREFIPGPYTARLFVDDREVGGPPFTILGDNPFETGPKISRLSLSTSVNRKMKPKKPSTQFDAGTKTLHATFDVAGAAPGTEIAVTWFRNGEPFSEQTLEVAPKGRFGVNVESPSGLPSGNYSVALEVLGEEKIRQDFTVGGAQEGTLVDKVALGLALGGDNLPVKEMTEFKADHPAIMCGLRFLDLSPGAVITVRWNLVQGESESTYHTTRTAVPQGGSGTMGAQWAPEGGFEEGDYKVVVLVDDEQVAQQPFTVK